MFRIYESDEPDRRLIPVMKTVDNWICWSYSATNNFVPLNTDNYQPLRNRFQPANYQNENIWLDYDTAKEKQSKYDAVDGIGFVFNDTNVSYVDLDDCIQKNQIPEEILELLIDIDSYTEISISGTGLHVYCHGNIPTYGSTPDSYSHNISIFDKSWAVVTENHIKSFPTIVQSNPEVLHRICREYIE